MNPNDTALPFFMQYLETQQTESEDTLSAQACNGMGQTQTPWGCWMDTKKYPSDGDDAAPSLPGI